MNRDKDIKKVVADHLQSMVYWKNIDASVVPELIGLLTQLSPKSFPNRPANLMSDASHFHYRFAKRSKTHEQSNARILCT
jgi:hypothetical protein